MSTPFGSEESVLFPFPVAVRSRHLSAGPISGSTGLSSTARGSGRTMSSADPFDADAADVVSLRDRITLVNGRTFTVAVRTGRSGQAARAPCSRTCGCCRGSCSTSANRREPRLLPRQHLTSSHRPRSPSVSVSRRRPGSERRPRTSRPSSSPIVNGSGAGHRHDFEIHNSGTEASREWCPCRRRDFAHVFEMKAGERRRRRRRRFVDDDASPRPHRSRPVSRSPRRHRHRSDTDRRRRGRGPARVERAVSGAEHAPCVGDVRAGLAPPADAAVVPARRSAAGRTGPRERAPGGRGHRFAAGHDRRAPRPGLRPIADRPRLAAHLRPRRADRRRGRRRRSVVHDTVRPRLAPDGVDGSPVRSRPGRGRADGARQPAGRRDDAPSRRKSPARSCTNSGARADRTRSPSAAATTAPSTPPRCS